MSYIFSDFKWTPWKISKITDNDTNFISALVFTLRQDCTIRLSKQGLVPIFLLRNTVLWFAVLHLWVSGESSVIQGSHKLWSTPFQSTDVFLSIVKRVSIFNFFFMWSKLIAEASSLDFVLKKANVIYSRTWDSTRTSTRVVPLSWSPEKTVMEIPLFTNFKFCLSWSITSTLDTWLGLYFLILIF